MIKNKLTILIIILFSILLYACETAKNAIEGKKRSEQSDEFLVEKKNPLAMPPDYEKLPTPGNQEVSPETFSDNNEIKDLLNIEDCDKSVNIEDCVASVSNNSDNSSDIESSIIKKIQ
jgi:hypothetical protein